MSLYPYKLGIKNYCKHLHNMHQNIAYNTI